MFKLSLSDYLDELERCAFCHDQCMSASPEVIASSEQALIRSRLATLLMMLQGGKWEWSGNAANRLFYALNDGIQFHYCIRAKKENQHTEPYIRAARAEAVDRGLAPASVKEAAERFGRTGNLFGMDAQAAVSAPVGTAPLLVYDAGTLARAPGAIDAARRLVKLVDDHAGEAVIASCGFVEFDLGLAEQAERAARAAHAQLEAIPGEGPIVTPDPVLAYALNVFYPQWGLALSRPVLHVSQYLADHAEKLPFSKAPVTVTYHDDWALARGLGEMEAPRKLLAAAGAAIFEPVNTREKAESDGPLAAYPDGELAKEIASLRYEELAETGADWIITASPYGRANLGAVEDDIPVEDLCEFLASRL